MPPRKFLSQREWKEEIRVHFWPFALQVNGQLVKILHKFQLQQQHHKQKILFLVQYSVIRNNNNIGPVNLDKKKRSALPCCRQLPYI